MQSWISYFFRIPNPGLQKSQIPDPENAFGDPPSRALILNQDIVESFFLSQRQMCGGFMKYDSLHLQL